MFPNERLPHGKGSQDLGMPTETLSITQLIVDAKEQAEREIGAVPQVAPPAKVEWPISCDIKQGLEGAVAAESKIGFVDGVRGRLVYRGYDIFDLCAHSTFEESSYLLLFGKLPTQGELDQFKGKLRDYQRILPTTKKLLEALPVKKLHPMALLEAGVLGAHAEDAGDDEVSDQHELEAAYRLIAQLMTVTGMAARLRVGKPVVDPDPRLSHAANLIYTMTGERPDEETERIMDVCLILHADHGMNASTFTSMVVSSTMSDMYFAISAGIGSLKGPLHGGANEMVLYDLEEIGTPGNVESWFDKARAAKRKIMGMGHRVYKAYDPRARVLKPLAKVYAQHHPEVASLFETADKLEAVAYEKMGKQKMIFPNVDFYSGLVYRAMGIETPMFTPLFAVSRVSGWAARCLEYRKNNRIFRPRGIYTGPASLDYTPIEQR